MAMPQADLSQTSLLYHGLGQEPPSIHTNIQGSNVRCAQCWSPDGLCWLCLPDQMNKEPRVGGYRRLGSGHKQIPYMFSKWI
ncbi:hypothetical protein PHLCEN_2v1821 [Hermanssonia centrifuga]|uniref:Uncharacterized protein n=1 Tax=Hermanssonia centrifuga TaxID=98765 RepID=A0A2R6RVS8_9APHY|nr:hypothetical protein PHLCEN_2v1821 [Hermanssonia centrifuga]